MDLSARFATATAAHDWDALEAAGAALARALPALAARGAWTESERAALLDLRAAHRRAHDACAHELESLDRRLADMHHDKAGWIAYALGNEPEPDGKQA